MVLEDEGCSLTAAGASVSTKPKDTKWMVKSRATQNGIHHPPAGTWWKFPLHHHDNSCYTIAIVTSWTLLVLNHTHSGLRANEEEPPPWLGAQLCPAAGPTPTHLCDLIQLSSMFPSTTLPTKLTTTTGSSNSSPSHYPSSHFMHFTVSSPLQSDLSC